MPQYTDYLDNPISVGDIVVYPRQRGSSAADLNTAVVVAIDDIIPNNPSDPKDCSGQLHKDRRQKSPPYRTIISRLLQNGAHANDYERDDSKAYMLSVKRIRDGSRSGTVYNPERITTLKNVDRVIVVTSLTSQREPVL